MHKNSLLIIFFVCTKAFSEVYVEAGPSFVSYRNTFGPSSIQTNQHIGKVTVGYEVSRIWSGEFMTGLGQISNGAVYVNGIDTPSLDIKFNKAYGVYLKGSHFINDEIDVFGRVGYATVKGFGSYQGFTETFEESGTSYGAGIRFNLDKTKYLTFDYLSFLKKGEMKINAVSINYGHKF